ncbi:hypothetical protein HRI_005240900 [Hibiscus trionum]|uniref:Nuclear transcription factor Y subunit n=1 Tax=Hibiscus trionum TaxID=183268 RepID=A0A9W7MVR7_HIBTR|nr:hypothetical protein HRI_005240900 [Hibiscus trionum]
MEIRVQNLPEKTFDGSSVRSLSHVSVSMPWWSSNEQQNAESLPQNMSLKVETPSQLYHHAKHLELQLPDQELTSVQAIDDTPREVGVIGATKSQSNPSESSPAESCGKDIEDQVKPVFLVNNPSTSFNLSLPNYNHPMVYAPYAYADTYFSGMLTPYGPQALAHLGGSAPTRIPLPLDLAEDEPIYVNPKQYHGILRRRKYRAKLEAQNKLVKSRKPYLHESRHLHALNRVRGSSGRFLSKNKLQQPDVNCTNRKNSRSELSSHCSHTAEYNDSSMSCSDISSASHNNGMPPRAGSMCGGTRRGTSVAL